MRKYEKPNLTLPLQNRVVFAKKNKFSQPGIPIESFQFFVFIPLFKSHFWSRGVHYTLCSFWVRRSLYRTQTANLACIASSMSHSGSQLHKTPSQESSFPVRSLHCIYQAVNSHPGIPYRLLLHHFSFPPPIPPPPPLGLSNFPYFFLKIPSYLYAKFELFSFYQLIICYIWLIIIIS